MTQQIEMGQATEVARKSYEGIPIYQSTDKPPKTTNSTSTDVIYRGTWHNEMVAKQKQKHSNAVP